MYSDGISVWNGNHTVQITGLLGESSTTQAVQIVPIPSSSPKKAFIFTLAAGESCYGYPVVAGYSSSGLRVSIATITGTAPATTITIAPTEKNIRISDGLNLMSEKMAVTSDGKGGYWLVAHGIGAYTSDPYAGSPTGFNTADERYFYAFNITCSTTTIPALAATKKKSNITNASVVPCRAWNHTATGFNNVGNCEYNGSGQMKIVRTSTTTAKLAMTVPYAFNSGWTLKPLAQLFNFNLVTGFVDNATAQQFDLGFNNSATNAKDGGAYGVEFSPDGNYLYVSSCHSATALGDMTSRIYQVDLTSAYPYTKTVIATLPHAAGPGFGGLQLGPDNKIYITRETKAFLDVINTPNNSAAAGVGYSSGVPIAGTCIASLPNTVCPFYSPTVADLYVPSSICAGDILTATGSYTGFPPASQLWEVYGSDVSGNPVDASGTIVSSSTASWYNTQQTIAGDAVGDFVYGASASLPCNKYFTVRLVLSDGCSASSEIKKTFYVKCYPIPAITASVHNPVCYGTEVSLCANYSPAPGVILDWQSNFFNYPSPGDNVTCITETPTQNTTYTVGVNLRGCRAFATYNLIMEQNNPNFNLTGNLGATDPYYTLIATPVVTPPTGIGYWWRIVEIDPSTGVDIAGTEVVNPSCWWTPGPNIFKNYTYLLAGSYPTGYTCGTPAGRFGVNKKYKVTYGTWSDNCPWQTTSKTIMLGHGMDGLANFIVEDAATDPAIMNSMPAEAASSAAFGEISVSPNPGNGVFILETTGLSGKNITMYDALGRLVYSRDNTTDSRITIDIANQPKGIYFLNVISNNKVFSKKIVLE